MLLDMQYCHACDMYKSSKDADSLRQEAERSWQRVGALGRTSFQVARIQRDVPTSGAPGSITCESRVVTQRPFCDHGLSGALRGLSGVLAEDHDSSALAHQTHSSSKDED